jgi:hypothetical protein
LTPRPVMVTRPIRVHYELGPKHITAQCGSARIAR